MMIRPPALRPGDRVAALSLSWGGPSLFPHRYETGKRQMAEAFGLEVIEGRYTRANADWLEGHPEARAFDLMQAFADPAIRGIVSTIGGDDSIRLLPFIDLNVIRANPKVFLGYSDTTVSHFACLKAGLTSFYGPSIMAGFGENGGLAPYLVESVKQTLFATEAPGEITPNLSGWTSERLEWGVPELQHRKRKLNPSSGWLWLQGCGLHRGKLVGGCLEVIDWLRGTPVWPDLSLWRESIFFLELSEESIPPSQVIRILRSLAATGALTAVRGILFGRPFGDASMFGAYDDALLSVLRELGMSEIPVITRMDFGHTDPMLVLPYGVEIELNCERRELRIIEPAVQ